MVAPDDDLGLNALKSRLGVFSLNSISQNSMLVFTKPGVTASTGGYSDKAAS